MIDVYKNLSKRNYELKRDEIAAAKRSLYYWWWRYLRISVDYWWLCRQKGKTQHQEFARTYEDFGDIFESSCNFDDWWTMNGKDLFAYRITPPKVSYYSDDEIKIRRRQNWYHTVIVPKFFNKTQILEQFDELFKNYQPEPMPSAIRSSRVVADLRGIRKTVLIDSHKVWCLNHAIQNARATDSLSNPGLYTQFWMGKKLSLTPSSSKLNRSTLSREAAENLTMRVKVNRYLAKAESVTRNVETGLFPCLKEAEPRKFWNKKQAAELARAIENGEWISPESTSEEIQSYILSGLN